jgi:hypothetical protein
MRSAACVVLVAVTVVAVAALGAQTLPMSPQVGPGGSTAPRGWVLSGAGGAVQLSLAAQEPIMLPILVTSPSGPTRPYVPRLMLRCQAVSSGTPGTSVVLSTDGWLVGGLDSAAVRLRFDSEATKRQPLSPDPLLPANARTARTATTYLIPSPYEFVPELASHRVLLMELTPVAANPQRVTFELAGLAEPLDRFERECAGAPFSRTPPLHSAQPAGPPPPAPAEASTVTVGKWTVDTSQSPMEDTPTILAHQQSSTSLKKSASRESKPLLVLRCRNGRTEAYVAATETAFDFAPVGQTNGVLRFDDHKQNMTLVSATSYKTLFIVETQRFLKEAARARQVTVTVQWGKLFTGEATFDLADFAQVVGRLRPGCVVDAAR